MVKIQSQVFMQHVPTSVVPRDEHFRFPYLSFRPPSNVISLCLCVCVFFFSFFFCRCFGVSFPCGDKKIPCVINFKEDNAN